jgi:hypothetical protein
VTVTSHFWTRVTKTYNFRTRVSKTSQLQTQVTKRSPLEPSDQNVQPPKWVTLTSQFRTQVTKISPFQTRVSKTSQLQTQVTKISQFRTRVSKKSLFFPNLLAFLHIHNPKMIPFVRILIWISNHFRYRRILNGYLKNCLYKEMIIRLVHIFIRVKPIILV